MTTRERIEAKLTEAFAPLSLSVVDDSHHHAGHIGHPGSGHPDTEQPVETHFSVKVVSQAFAGKRRIECHRMVNGVLAAELAAGVHALAIDARAPAA